MYVLVGMYTTEVGVGGMGERGRGSCCCSTEYLVSLRVMGNHFSQMMDALQFAVVSIVSSSSYYSVQSCSGWRWRSVSLGRYPG